MKKNMKVVLLHGPAKVASRKKLIELKQKFDPNNVVVFENGASIQDISASIATLPMFSDERLIILENIDENIIFDLPLITYHSSLIFWFDHAVVKKAILEFIRKNNGQVLFFEGEREISVFPFLDLLADGNKKAFLEIKKLKERNFDIFYFNTMVFYLLRNLVNTPKNAPAFVLQKLERQRKNFNLQRITRLYKEVLELDFKLKNGQIEPLHAEFVMINNFMG